MDCPSCAAKIEKAVKAVGVEGAEISTATQILKVALPAGGDRKGAMEAAIADIGYGLDEITGNRVANPGAHLGAGYRRALWIVIILNAGFGVIEMVAGFLTGSQGLKADALDFIGDGLITFLGLLAIGWSLRWRARSALIQGLFLGAMGLGVLLDTFTKLGTGREVEAGAMGAVAMVALAINIAAALVLIPHRAGDANVRAVWLFSRNDAFGNAAVVVAALLVGWTGSAWPDLAVAFIMAGLFLQSSGSIVRDSLRELRR
ncbi:MAG TPA: cation diffusion facilitator family transporter [Rhodobacterales bacterium]|nr:cation diffusion facilitator family transporter [Rhodobacterales bacterium]